MNERPRGAYARALAFCRRRRLFSAGDRVLVGSGGGAASLGVLGFLRLAQAELALGEVAVCAVDRGGADDPDAVADVGRFARLLGASFYAVSAEGARPTAALLQLAQREGFRRVALGQTRDDAVARVLAQLARGGGLARVRPLAAKRRDGVVRPLLDLRDGEALELARTAGIEPPPLLAPAPLERATLAMRLRGAVLPRLRVEAPGVDEALLTAARDARSLARLVASEAERRVAAAIATPQGLELTAVAAAGALPTAVARAALRRLGVPASVAHAAEVPLGRMLSAVKHGENSREVVLGPGLLATYLPARRVVALRVMHVRRAPGEVIG